MDTTDANSQPAEGQATGQLLATRLVLREALDRLQPEQRQALQAALSELLTGLHELWDCTISESQQHILDEIRAIEFRLRYSHTLTETVLSEQPSYTGICMRCETFPLELGAPCPVCATGKYVTALRI